MKVLFLSVGLSLWTIFSMQASIEKSVVATAGSLSDSLTDDELSTVSKLTITGTLDARDFKVMRDSMPMLEKLDIQDCTISEYTGAEGTSNATNVVYSLNSIPQYAFSSVMNNKKCRLKHIVLPSSLYSIGLAAFCNCDSLQKVTYPTTSNFRYIEQFAFQYCIALDSIVIPPYVEFIDSYAYTYCTDVTYIYLPAATSSFVLNAFSGTRGEVTVDPSNTSYRSIDGALYKKDTSLLIHYPVNKNSTFMLPERTTGINEWAFQGDTVLSSIVLPPTVKTIGAHAFSGCKNLVSITLPDSLQFLGYRAFAECSSLPPVCIPKGVSSDLLETFVGSSGYIEVDAANPVCCAIGGVLYSKDTTHLICCPTCVSGRFVMPPEVSKLESLAFLDCSALSVMHLSENLFYIDYHVFENCLGLDTLFVYKTDTANIYLEEEAFFDFPAGQCVLVVPAGCVDMYRQSSGWKVFGTITDGNITALETSRPTSDSWVADGALWIRNLRAGETISLYTIQGILVNQTTATDGTIQLELPRRGLYMVRVGERVVKFIF